MSDVKTCADAANAFIWEYQSLALHVSPCAPTSSPGRRSFSDAEMVLVGVAVASDATAAVQRT
jgi:hypothetical protein